MWAKNPALVCEPGGAEAAAEDRAWLSKLPSPGEVKGMEVTETPVPSYEKQQSRAGLCQDCSWEPVALGLTLTAQP